MHKKNCWIVSLLLNRRSIIIFTRAITGRDCILAPALVDQYHSSFAISDFYFR